MNVVVVVFVAALAVAHAGVIAHSGLVAHSVVAPVVRSTHIQGPSTSTHIVGPDGSQIVAHAPGASVSTAEHVGVASDVIAPVAYSSAYVAAPVVHAAPFVHAAPVVHAAPFIAGHGVVAARTLIASPVGANGYPIFAAGSGLEGQFIPDINEKLYDDGSYHGEIY